MARRGSSRRPAGGRVFQSKSNTKSLQYISVNKRMSVCEVVNGFSWVTPTKLNHLYTVLNTIVHRALGGRVLSVASAGSDGVWLGIELVEPLGPGFEAANEPRFQARSFRSPRRRCWTGFRRRCRFALYTRGVGRNSNGNGELPHQYLRRRKPRCAYVNAAGTLSATNTSDCISSLFGLTFAITRARTPHSSSERCWCTLRRRAAAPADAPSTQDRLLR